jgi:hypothetical protein
MPAKGLSPLPLPGAFTETRRHINYKGDNSIMDDKQNQRREFVAKNCQQRPEKSNRIVIDEWWNTPLWNGKNADGVHHVPKVRGTGVTGPGFVTGRPWDRNAGGSFRGPHFGSFDTNPSNGDANGPSSKFIQASTMR